MAQSIPPIYIPEVEDIKGLRNAVELALNRLVLQLNQQTQTKDIDTKDHRIKNVAWPIEWHDAVNVEYLVSVLPKKKKKISTSQIASAGSPGSVSFTPFVPGNGMVGLRAMTVSGNADFLHVITAYVDEPSTPYMWFTSTGTVDGTSTSITLTSPLGTQTSTNTFSSGDFIIWDDSDQDSNNLLGTSTDTWARKYEMGQITALSTDTSGQISSVTISRAQYFDSFRASHEPLKKIYKLKLNYFSIPTDLSGISSTAQIKDELLPLPSAAVAAIAIACDDNGSIGAFTIENCNQIAYPYPGNADQNPPAPGMRTCNGAEYVMSISGSVAQSAICTNWPWVPESASIRCAPATARIAPTGGRLYNGTLRTTVDAAIVIYVLYVEPRDTDELSRRVALIEQVDIVSSFYDSFTHLASKPQDRRTPYNLLWPCAELPVIGTVNDIIDVSTGSVRSGVLPPILSNTYIPFKEGGQVGFVIDVVGSTQPGAEITVNLTT